MLDRRACEQCGRSFIPSGKHAGVTNCGRIVCRSTATFTPEDWAGQRRMAAARAAAGLPYGALDRRAIERDPDLKVTP